MFKPDNHIACLRALSQASLPIQSRSGSGFLAWGSEFRVMREPQRQRLSSNYPKGNLQLSTVAILVLSFGQGLDSIVPDRCLS